MNKSTDEMQSGSYIVCFTFHLKYFFAIPQLEFGLQIV